MTGLIYEEFLERFNNYMGRKVLYRIKFKFNQNVLLLIDNVPSHIKDVSFSISRLSLYLQTRPE